MSRMQIEEYNQHVRQIGPMLFRFSKRHLKNTDDANEIVQHSFEKLWIHREKVESAKVKSYLFTVAWHKIINEMKQKQKFVDLESASNVPDEAYKQGDPNLKDIINKAMDSLPPIQKTIVLLKDLEGYNYHEIGEITKLNDSQVKVYLFRARQKLKNYLVNLEAVI